MIASYFCSETLKLSGYASAKEIKFMFDSNSKVKVYSFDVGGVGGEGGGMFNLHKSFMWHLYPHSVL